jgi:hypothetical protein
LRFFRGRELEDATVATFSTPTQRRLVTDYTAVVDWGDGTTSAATIVPPGDSFSVVGSHMYAKPADYTIQTTITSKYGTTANATTTVTRGRP